MSPLLLGIIFLALTVVATSAFTFIMRYSQEKGYSVLAVGGVNYLAAALAAACLTNLSQVKTVPLNLWLLASASGLGFLLTYLLLTSGLRRHGVTVPSAAVQVAMVVPVSVSALFWHEHLGPGQAVGVLIALTAILLLTPSQGTSGAEAPARWTYWLVPGIFALSGATRLTQKVISMYSPAGQGAGGALALIWFGTAAVFSVGMLRITDWPTRAGEWVAGICLGLVNLATFVFLLRTLASLQAVIVFPAVSCLSLILISAGGFVFWNERPGRRGALGLLTAMVAVVLVGAR